MRFDLDMLGDFSDAEIASIFDCGWEFDDYVVAENSDVTRTIMGRVYFFEFAGYEEDQISPEISEAEFRCRVNASMWDLIADGVNGVVLSRLENATVYEPTEEEAIRNMLAANNASARAKGGR